MNVYCNQENCDSNRDGQGTRGSVMFTDGSCSNYQDKIASSVIEPERALYHIPQNFKEAYYAG